MAGGSAPGAAGDARVKFKVVANEDEGDLVHERLPDHLRVARVGAHQLGTLQHTREASKHARGVVSASE